MKPQSYSNHARYVPLFHFVLSGIIIFSFIASVTNLILSISSGESIFSAILITLTFISLILVFVFVRAFPNTVQDRTIRAEENLRHYVLTGKLLSPQLTIRQIIGLRFAPDDEFVMLAERAVSENLSEDEIKKSIKNWRPDHLRA